MFLPSPHNPEYCLSFYIGKCPGGTPWVPPDCWERKVGMVSEDVILSWFLKTRMIA